MPATWKQTWKKDHHYSLNRSFESWAITDRLINRNFKRGFLPICTTERAKRQNKDYVHEIKIGSKSLKAKWIAMQIIPKCLTFHNANYSAIFDNVYFPHYRPPKKVYLVSRTYLNYCFFYKKLKFYQAIYVFKSLQQLLKTYIKNYYSKPHIFDGANAYDSTMRLYRCELLIRYMKCRR